MSEPPAALLTEPARPKLPRRRSVVIDVPPWQEDWPVEAQTKCYYQRRELAAAQAVITRQNALIKMLRQQLRQSQRVWRLRLEARTQGASEAYARMQRGLDPGESEASPSQR
ncbi:MAG: hypothetical protein RL685_1556 [Pseudomonadota bacterium]|jgi:hypothetical protein